jgi:holo-[acyl-carrier protein] synthase
MDVCGVGTGIIECLRIAKMIERHGERFLCRVFTEHEIQYCQRRHAATQHFAGRWVAKEAVLRALGTPWVQGITWRDMEIRTSPTGVATVSFRGGLRDVVEQTKAHNFQISISYCRSHATALVIALADPAVGEEA